MKYNIYNSKSSINNFKTKIRLIVKPDFQAKYIIILLYNIYYKPRFAIKILTFLFYFTY